MNKIKGGEQLIIYIFAGFTIGGVVVVSIFAICAVVVLLKQDKD